MEGAGRKKAAYQNRLLALLIAGLAFCPNAYGDEVSIRLCSHNLFRWSDPEKNLSPAQLSKQEGYLVDRMAKARCDLVAVQELTGRSKKEAQKIANTLAASLSARTGKTFIGITRGSNDARMRNGFLVSTDVFQVKSVRSYHRRHLPKLQPSARPEYFPRGPMGLVLSGPAGLRLFVVTMHFKSKAGGWKDPSKTQFEGLRMQMAEGLRMIALNEAESLGEGTIPIIMGDRNNTEYTASAQILFGARKLRDFSAVGGCSLTSELTPKCRGLPEREPEFVGLLGRRKNEGPEGKNEGSYRYKKRYQLIDEILVRPKELGLFLRKDGKVAAGYQGQFYRGSDHKLIWAELRMRR